MYCVTSQVSPCASRISAFCKKSAHVAERESPRKCMSFHDFFSLFCLLSVTMVRAARRSLAATRESGMVQRASAVAATSTIAA